MKYEKKLLIIPDQHTHYSKLERIISKFHKTHKFIWMGDEYDQFGDTPELNAYMAKFMKNTMAEFPDWVYLYGNHTVIYHPDYSCMCSGFSSQKKVAINEVMTIQDWDKLKYFHHENGWWFSHAGITKYWFQHPMSEGFTIENIQRIIDHSIIKLKVDDHSNAIWASSHTRGGNHAVGGIVWQDWRDLELIPNFKQVVGHTPLNRIQAISDNAINSTIINVDNSRTGVYFSELLEIDESGNHKTIDTSYI
jgi:hypothetical protein